jgi:LysM repeat protein
VRRSTEERAVRRWLLIVGLACILSGVALFCAWAAVSWRVLSTYADSPAARTATTSSLVHSLPTRAAILPPRSSPTRVAATVVPHPTATPQPVVEPARPAAGSILLYQVKPGDTLFTIALNFDVRLDALVQFNQIADPEMIWAGQELIIPGEGVPTPTRPAATRAASRAATRLPIALLPPAPGQVNGVPVEQLIVMSDAVQQNIRKIYAQGQARGNNPHAFSKIGDSNMENPYFLASFDNESCNLGQYAYLAPAIDYFAGSFGRQSMAVRVGFHSWSVLDATMADKTNCWPDETPLDCELRLHNPGIVLIRLGTNDTGYPERLQERLQTIVRLCIQRGIIPVLGTKADRAEGPENINNMIIRQIAAENNIPLWDFDLVAQTMPDSGLGRDHVHLTTFYPLDYTSPEAFQHGHSVDDLTALIVLDKVWRSVAQVNP